MYISLWNQCTNSTGSICRRNMMTASSLSALKKKSSRQRSFQMEHTWLTGCLLWTASAGCCRCRLAALAWMNSASSWLCCSRPVWWGRAEVSPPEAVTHKHCVFSKHISYTGAWCVRWYTDPHLLGTSKTKPAMFIKTTICAYWKPKYSTLEIPQQGLILCLI